MTTTERTRFYQVGSWAAGNRLLDPSQAAVQATAGRTNALTSGHRACQGCGEALAARWVLDTAVTAAEGKLVVVNATGCLEVFSTPYPESSWRVPWLHSLFGNAPAVAGGVAAALSAQGRDDVRVIAQAGDGGTVDIGMGCLSGMFERGDDVLFVCYDNGGYMNTGVQRSAATPAYARTTTTPVAADAPGNPAAPGKDMARIAMAHRIPYVATATVADLRDLEAKVRTAMAVRGARYLHVLVPCPLGWGTPSGDTIAVARLATQSGLFPVFEAADGKVTAVTPIRHLADVRDYLRAQGRYRHLFEPHPRMEILAAIEAAARHNIAEYGLLNGTADAEEAEIR
jgi:pyruvate ferredoxin oxidoreductase beta subunit